MAVLEKIETYRKQLIAIRQDFHEHPELGMEEYRTSDTVADLLQEWGITVHRNIGGTGIVGVLKNGTSTRSIGLRADMDALPMEELGNLAYRSVNAGRMHACGHDGHTTMLLGAARYLAETRRFDGTVNFIFQPAEEGRGGAAAMLRDGLFEDFPCQSIFGMHNWPGLAVGRCAINAGALWAGGGFFEITVKGRGAHGARPERAIDPMLCACHVVTALQSIVSRNVPPYKEAVISVTRIEGGHASNVIPDSVTIGGTLRCLDPALLQDMRARMHGVATGVASAFGATAEVEFPVEFLPVINDPTCTELMVAAAGDICGTENINPAMEPVMTSEDFSYMLERVPGAYLCLGNGDTQMLHHPEYNFNDEALVFGASILSRLAERALPVG
ncbi:M20 aminoacylase family protein [Komagataeibacter medellinensis]|uniref:Peptidase M20D, amidohydrolase n=1 Tax=Komagataeibacter medellinensis (strain NBRC 3288 / BCRC 11682 / LMG 1693 / Kondo 51) TaxID=634177 RepID=G2I276_KOMMN|nr:M20 aminoacylase family protein [Komagataeibacter medellinensis]BAK82492.1 peptidase M20D, amidohydrolase [Komagataeibacter medellinensis NBRC 3288]